MHKHLIFSTVYQKGEKGEEQMKKNSQHMELSIKSSIMTTANEK
jgi:hypothetical protein